MQHILAFILILWLFKMTEPFTFDFQVPFFLFIIFTVYTMLPFQLWYAVVLSVISSLSHIIALSLRLTVFNQETHPYLSNQVKPFEYRLRHFFCCLFVLYFCDII